MYQADYSSMFKLILGLGSQLYSQSKIFVGLFLLSHTLVLVDGILHEMHVTLVLEVISDPQQVPVLLPDQV